MRRQAARARRCAGTRRTPTPPRGAARRRTRGERRHKAHYDETQADCNQATLAHLATLRIRLAALVDIGRAQAAVRAEPERAAKRARWEELKLASITRTIAALYALVLAHLLMRVATNLVARHLMLAHAAQPAAAAAARDGGGGGATAGGQNGRAGEDVATTVADRAGLSVASQLYVLAAADHLVKGDGLHALLAAVGAAVAPALAPMADAEPFDDERLARLLASIRAPLELDGGAYARLLACALPPYAADADADGDGDGGALAGDAVDGARALAWTNARLRDEVRDAVCSAPFAVLAQQTLDCAFAELHDDLARRATGVPQPAAGGERDRRDACAAAEPPPLAKVIPRIANCFGAVLDSSAPPTRDAAPPNRYLRAACAAPSLDELCFMVYAPPPAEGDVAACATGEADCYTLCVPGAL
mgnify:CR=1 FL=1